MLRQRRCRYRQRRHTAQATAQAHVHGIWPVAKQPHVDMAWRLIVSTSVIHVSMWITAHFPIPGGWEAELA